MNRLSAILVAILFTGCSGAATVPQSQSGNSQLTPTSIAARPGPEVAASGTGANKHLYTLDFPMFVNHEQVNEYALPLTSNPTPAVTILLNPPVFVCSPAVNTTTLFISCHETSNKPNLLFVFPLPLQPGEVPLHADKAFHSTVIAADNNTLYAESPSGSPPALEAFKLPYVPREAPFATIALPSTFLIDPPGVATVGSQFLKVELETASASVVLESFALPLRSGESPSAKFLLSNTEFGTLAQSTDNLYVAFMHFPAKPAMIEQFPLPLTSSSTPAMFSIPVFQPDVIAANEHYLYVGGIDSQIRVYHLPLSSDQRTFLTVNGVVSLFGMVFGP